MTRRNRPSSRHRRVGIERKRRARRVARKRKRKRDADADARDRAHRVDRHRRRRRRRRAVRATRASTRAAVARRRRRVSNVVLRLLLRRHRRVPRRHRRRRRRRRLRVVLCLAFERVLASPRVSLGQSSVAHAEGFDVRVSSALRRARAARVDAVVVHEIHRRIRSTPRRLVANERTRGTDESFFERDALDVARARRRDAARRRPRTEDRRPTTDDRRPTARVARLAASSRVASCARVDRRARAATAATDRPIDRSTRVDVDFERVHPRASIGETKRSIARRSVKRNDRSRDRRRARDGAPTSHRGDTPLRHHVSP